MRLNWKSLWILGVVILFLLAAYLLQELSDDGDGAAPDVPDSELTPASGITLVPGASNPSERQATVSAAGTVSSDPTVRDLQLDELRGGHTIARHVGKTDAELRARLEDEPDISAASTFPDLATAQRVVQRALDEERSEVEAWEKRTGSRPNLSLRTDMNETIGRSIKQGASGAEECEHAVVVLRWGNNNWYVLTSYPECR